MRRITLTLWAFLALLALLWLAAEPTALTTSGIFPLRTNMMQLTGVIAFGAMSAAMILALRPRLPEGWFGGLDKMYRLHKWLGITALTLSVIHFLWAKGPRWAIGWGLLERPQRGPRPPIENPIEQTLSSLRGLAEEVGEWAFYAAAALMVLALVKWFPYRWFQKTHRLIAVAYLVLAFHTIVLVKFAYWTTALGLVTGLMLVPGVVAAVIVLFRRVAADRKVEGTLTALDYFPGVKVLVADVTVPTGWPGHRAGQFAFAMSNPSEGPHPYTIASAWDPTRPVIRFVIKELGDHTSRLRDRLRIGQPVMLEGPYGRFTFDDGRPRQIWIGAGIGVTPFIARMQQLATEGGATIPIDFFHPTTDLDEDAIARLTEDAAAAGVRLHVIHSPRDGRLTAPGIRAAVPDWKDASFWFCGPAAFGQTLRRDFVDQGLDADAHFHQELFEMR